MSLFAPIFRTEGFETIGYWDICHRLGSRGPVDAALAEGVLAAHVQVDGEDPRQFYKVPRDHWRGPGAFMEGEPGEDLFCWGSSDVPAKFQQRPLIFFVPEVEQWIRTLPREPLGEIAGSTGLGEDAEALEDSLNRATMPIEGYWSVFATLAWIVSREERFVAAAQLFEVERHADRGVFCAFAWHALGNKAGELFGQTFSDVEAALREAVQSNRLRGGSAIDMRSGESVLIERHQWRLWQRSFETRWGTVVIPGFYKVGWPSEAVRAAFPPKAAAAAVQSPPDSARSSPSRQARALTAQQRRLGRFFKLADGEELDHLTHDQLFSRYQTWNTKENRSALTGTDSVKLSAFKKWRARWRTGERWT